MTHRYKQVPPKQPEPLSFVKAVMSHGDLWALAIPDRVRERMPNDRCTFDGTEAASMYYMETGLFPRIKYEDLQA